MPRIFDPTTQKEITGLPEEQLNEAVATGKATFAKGDTVPVIFPDGDAGTVPAEHVQQAIKQGYKIETPIQQAVREHVQANDNIKGSVKVGLDQFANQALFGVPGIINEKMETPLEKLKREALVNDHQISNAVGGVGGFGASLFVGGPLFKGAGVAARGAEAIVAEQLAAAGIKRGAKSLASDLAARIATNATKLGVESAIIASPQAAAHAVVGDPDLAAETLLGAGTLGAGLGIVGTPAVSLLETLGRKGTNIVKKFAGIGSEASAAIPGVEGAATTATGAVDDSLLANAGKDQSMADKIKQGIQQLKPNAPEIQSASEALGLTPTEGMLSGSKFIQDMDSALSKNVTSTGMKRAQKYEEIYNKLEGTLRESFATQAPESAVAAGDQIKGIIRKGVEERYAPFNEAYDKIKEISGGLKIPLEQLNTLSADINNFAGQQFKKFQPMIKGYAEQVLEKEGSADNLDSVIRSIKDDITAATRAGKYEDAKILQDLKSKVSNFSDEQISAQVKKLQAQGVPEANSFLMYKDVTNAGYKDFKDLMGTLSGAAKVRGHGIKDVLENLDDVASEKLVDRLFDKKNARAMEFMKKEFPEAFDIVSGFKKRQIIEAATKDDRVGVGSIMSATKASKLSPEVQALIFTPEQAQKLSQVRTVFESLPKDVNPSGTARGIEFNHFFNPFSPSDLLKYATGEVKDKLKQSFLEHAVQNRGIAQSATKATEKINRIPEALDNFISKKRIKVTPEQSAITAIQRFLGTDKKMTREEQLHEMNDKLSTFTQNPSLSADQLSKVTHGIPNNVAQSISAKKAQTAIYLMNHIPKPIAPPTPFQKNYWKPTDADMSRFARRVKAVNDPLSMIDELENGTLSRETVDTVQTVYPKLFEIIKGKVVDAMSDREKPPTYAARLKLSLFMGENFDNSLKPQNIQMLQQRFAQNPVQQPKPSGTLKMPSLQTEMQKLESGK